MLKRNSKFTMRVNDDDDELFSELARRLNRSKSDAIRSIVGHVVEAMRAEEKIIPLRTSNDLIQDAH
jgi:hypothetical protein